MTRCSLICVLLATGLSTLSLSAQAPNLEKMDAVQRALPDGPVALVDGQPVKRGDFLFLYQSQCMMLASQGRTLDEDLRIKAGITTLAELVQREILNQLGERRNLKVTQAEIDAAYTQQMKTLVERFTTEEHTPTEEEILTRSGQTREDALEDIRKALMVERASEALAEEKKITVSDAEAREFFNKYQERFQRPGRLHLNQIYVRPGKDPMTATEKDWAAAEEKIKKAAARFKVGDTFEGIAKSMSDGKDKENGGDMGMRPVQELFPGYVEQSKSMKEGEISAPFKSDYGWHIIRLIGREAEADIPFEKAKDGIKRQLREIKKLAAVDEYCRPIMGDDSRVQIFLHLDIPESVAEASQP
jgi:foldase protein PrsA